MVKRLSEMMKLVEGGKVHKREAAKLEESVILS